MRSRTSTPTGLRLRHRRNGKIEVEDAGGERFLPSGVRDMGSPGSRAGDAGMVGGRSGPRQRQDEG